MIKRSARIKLILLLLVIALLIPYPFSFEQDDGGTVYYRAVLWSLEKRHRLWRDGDIHGYMVGTVVRVLSFELYNDVTFVPVNR